jgi:hypothetical protein
VFSMLAVVFDKVVINSGREELCYGDNLI